ncbi:protein BTG3 [Erpetoichthys calabaricus]|uniref:B-cell translocation gene 3 n=1 Tax=Erpetoichthys calabaricus TaxID=27687 RepID=A0A8C4X4K3_ERPCA|nr:protein BTG3 [Erpetoichthys calabaricus]XP_028655970.1 protein BTG3 [Erpetoichthys calabaricus]XP_028655971.1 protein BTG3 [Erpetoichthys calabaricus]XP_028655972.1 protein BTG3 [Erpetoichthys calabaricus]
MRKEIAAVIFFLARLIRKNDRLKNEELEMFTENLSKFLQEKYKGHWYPENPSKGQAYRCIRVNKTQGVDPVLQRACEDSKILYSDLGLPKELTLWIDPCEVCCRYGEKNHAFTLATFSSGEDNEDSQVNSPKSASSVNKITSDYHSCSSSDEENSNNDSKLLSQCTYLSPQYYQIPTVSYRPIQIGQQYPQKKSPVYKNFSVPLFDYTSQPHGRNMKLVQQMQWIPAAGMGQWMCAQSICHT